MFGKVSIIGMGLIGSSLARAIRKHGLAETICCVDINPKVCDKALELGIADEATTSLSKGVAQSDFILVCTPVGASKVIAESISTALKDGVIITDVGSVKQSVIENMEKNLPPYAHFVPGHPIAGSEKSGPESGFHELFEGRWVILTPTVKTSLDAVEIVSKFWQACGSRIELMDAQHHDLILAITSHLPHLISYTIVDTANNLEDDIKSEVIKYSASGFRGFTRLAGSDPTMWRDVFLSNKRAVLEILGRFSEDLSDMQRAIRKGDGDFLYNTFSRTRKIREDVLELGPEGYPSPERMKIKD